MTRDEIQAQLVAQLRRIRKRLGDLPADTRLAELGLDSADVAMWLCEAESDFDVVLDDSDLTRLRDATLSDLVDLVEQALARKPS